MYSVERFCCCDLSTYINRTRIISTYLFTDWLNFLMNVTADNNNGALKLEGPDSLQLTCGVAIFHIENQIRSLEYTQTLVQNMQLICDFWAPTSTRSLFVPSLTSLNSYVETVSLLVYNCVREPFTILNHSIFISQLLS